MTLACATILTALLMRSAAWYAAVVWPIVPSIAVPFWMTVGASAVALRRVRRLRPAWRSVAALAVLWLMCVDAWTDPYPTPAERGVRDAWAAILSCLIMRVFLGALCGSSGGIRMMSCSTVNPVNLNVQLTVRARPDGGWTLESAR